MGPAEVHELTAWLARHGRHVRRLTLTAAPEDTWDEGEACDVEEALNQCLATPGLGEQLVHLEVDGVSSTEWLAGLPLLRQLTITGALRTPLHIAPTISALTALGSLQLDGDRLRCEAGLRLPACLTRLCLGDFRLPVDGSPNLLKKASRPKALSCCNAARV